MEQQPVQHEPTKSGVILIRFIAVLILVLILTTPGYIFFSERGGFTFVQGADAQAFARMVFPLFGLYAFTLIWEQIMVGAGMPIVRRFFPGIVRYHRAEGVVAFVFALTHPFLLIGSLGIAEYLRYEFIGPTQKVFVWLGIAAISLLTLTVLTALLMHLPWLRRRWKVLHYANFAVFVLVYIHSWNLGTDIQGTSLRYLWLFFAISAGLATSYRLVRWLLVKRKQGSEARSPVGQSGQG